MHKYSLGSFLQVCCRSFKIYLGISTIMYACASCYAELETMLLSNFSKYILHSMETRGLLDDLPTKLHVLVSSALTAMRKTHLC